MVSSWRQVGGTVLAIAQPMIVEALEPPPPLAPPGVLWTLAMVYGLLVFLIV